MTRSRLIRIAASLGISLLFTGALAACGTTFAMAPDSTVPFAKGEIDVKEVSKDGNATLELRVEHLGDPGKLNPSSTVYVVWIMPKGKEDANINNAGALKVDSDYSGDHTFSTPFKSFDVTVTPEASADVTKPTGRDVLKASITLE